MTAPRYTPNPSVLRAVRAVLVRCLAVWPRHFALVNDASVAGTDFVTEYCRACERANVSIEAIHSAADAWLENERFPPAPADLAQLGRAIARRLTSHTSADEVPPLPQPKPLTHDERTAAVDAMNLEAYRVLRSWRLVMEATALALAECKNEQEQHAVRNGLLSADAWALVVSRVAHGEWASDATREKTRGVA